MNRRILKIQGLLPSVKQQYSLNGCIMRHGIPSQKPVVKVSMPLICSRAYWRWDADTAESASKPEKR